jgi:hypothetical protein
MSKGSKKRPASISDEEFKREWDRIFGPKHIDVICDCGERFTTPDEDQELCPACQKRENNTN